METKGSAAVCDDWVAMIRLAGGPRAEEGLRDLLAQAFQTCERTHPRCGVGVDALKHLIGCRVLAAYMVYLTSQEAGSIDDLRGSDEDRVSAMTRAAQAMPNTLVDTDLQTALRMDVTMRSMVFRAIGF